MINTIKLNARKLWSWFCGEDHKTKLKDEQADNKATPIIFDEQEMESKDSTVDSRTNSIPFRSTGNFELSKTYGSSGFDEVVPWLVKNMIPSKSTGILFGATQTFKTFVAIDICCRIALGIPFNQLKTVQGLVVFIAAEGGRGISKRVRAWEKLNGHSVGSNLIIIGHTVFPTVKEQRDVLISEINKESIRQGKPVALIVFDTLSQCSNGMPENDAAAGSIYINECNNISKQLDSTVINIHHTNKSKDEFRGSSTLEGNVDFMIKARRQSRAQQNETILSLHKMKEGSTDYKWRISLDGIEIDAKDEDDLPMQTLCVTDIESINEFESTEGEVDQATSKTLSDAEFLLKALKFKGPKFSMSTKMICQILQSGSIYLDDIDLPNSFDGKIKMRATRAKRVLVGRNLISVQRIGKESYITLLHEDNNQIPVTGNVKRIH